MAKTEDSLFRGNATHSHISCLSNIYSISCAPGILLYTLNFTLNEFKFKYHSITLSLSIYLLLKYKLFLDPDVHTISYRKYKGKVKTNETKKFIKYPTTRVWGKIKPNM